MIVFIDERVSLFVAAFAKLGQILFLYECPVHDTSIKSLNVLKLVITCQRVVSGCMSACGVFLKLVNRLSACGMWVCDCLV